MHLLSLPLLLLLTSLDPVLANEVACLTGGELVALIFGCISGAVVVVGLVGASLWYFCHWMGKQKELGAASTGLVESCLVPNPVPPLLSQHQHQKLQDSAPEQVKKTRDDGQGEEKKLRDVSTFSSQTRTAPPAPLPRQKRYAESSRTKQDTVRPRSVESVRRAEKCFKLPLRSKDFSHGLGFTICGNMRQGIFVKEILEGGPAEASGRLKSGDRILNMKVSFENMVYEDALTILSYASPYELELEFMKAGAAKGSTLTNGPPWLSNYVRKTTNSPRPCRNHPFIRSHSLDALGSYHRHFATDEKSAKPVLETSLRCLTNNETDLEAARKKADTNVWQQRAAPHILPLEVVTVVEPELKGQSTVQSPTTDTVTVNVLQPPLPSSTDAVAKDTIVVCEEEEEETVFVHTSTLLDVGFSKVPSVEAKHVTGIIISPSYEFNDASMGIYDLERVTGTGSAIAKYWPIPELNSPQGSDKAQELEFHLELSDEDKTSQTSLTSFEENKMELGRRSVAPEKYLSHPVLSAKEEIIKTTAKEEEKPDESSETASMNGEPTSDRDSLSSAEFCLETAQRKLELHKEVLESDIKTLTTTESVALEDKEKDAAPVRAESSIAADAISLQSSLPESQRYEKTTQTPGAKDEKVAITPKDKILTKPYDDDLVYTIKSTDIRRIQVWPTNQQPITITTETFSENQLRATPSPRLVSPHLTSPRQTFVTSTVPLQLKSSSKSSESFTLPLQLCSNNSTIGGGFIQFEEMDTQRISFQPAPMQTDQKQQDKNQLTKSGKTCFVNEKPPSQPVEKQPVAITTCSSQLQQDDTPIFSQKREQQQIRSGFGGGAWQYPTFEARMCTEVARDSAKVPCGNIVPEKDNHLEHIKLTKEDNGSMIQAEKAGRVSQKRDSGYGTLSLRRSTEPRSHYGFTNQREGEQAKAEFEMQPPTAPPSVVDAEQYRKLLYYQQQLARQHDELAKLGVEVPAMCTAIGGDRVRLPELA